jgi:hypothetical protein
MKYIAIPIKGAALMMYGLTDDAGILSANASIYFSVLFAISVSSFSSKSKRNRHHNSTLLKALN